MKSIGLCIGLFAIAMAAVVIARPGSNAKTASEPLGSSDREVAVAETVPSQDSVAVAKEQVAKEPATKEPATNEPATKERATNERATNERAVLEPDAESSQATKVPVDPRTKGVVIKKSSAAARAKGEITFDDLQFEIEKDAKFGDEMLDDDVKSLDGLDVRLNGFILPTTLFKEKDIDQFVLVRDNQECCFGPGAALFDCVIVEMQDGNTTDFVTRPVTVYGKLKIDTKRYKYPGGKGPRGTTHFAIFRIEGQQVK